VVHLGRLELRVWHVLIGLAAAAAVLVVGTLLLVLSEGRAHALDLPVGDTRSPLAPVVNAMSPVLPGPPTPQASIADSATTPVAPAVQTATTPLTPVAQTTTPLTPVVQDVTGPLVPVLPDVTAPLAPVVQTVTTPLAPVAEPVTGPLTGVTAPVLGTVGPALGPVVGGPSAAAPLVTLLGERSDPPRGPQPPTATAALAEPTGPSGVRAPRESTAGTHRAASSLDADARAPSPLPTPAPLPPAPASPVPGTASSSPLAPSFQLVVYAIVAMLAALLVPRGRRALRLGAVAPRAAFASLIERPG
jgi:hypothetical protein